MLLVVALCSSALSVYAFELLQKYALSRGKASKNRNYAYVFVKNAAAEITPTNVRSTSRKATAAHFISIAHKIAQMKQNILTKSGI